MAIKNHTPGENTRREKIRKLLQIANIGSMGTAPDDEPGYSKYENEHKETEHSHNGYGCKTLCTSFGDVAVSFP